jgi:hypothetical protein
LHRRPWVLSKSIHSFLPLRHYSLESLTAHKTPWPFLLLPRGPSHYANSTRGKEKGGAAYRRWERSGEGRGWLREALAVTARYGSTAVVAGIDRSTCAGGWSRRWRVFRLNHGDLVQLNGTMSSTGWRRGYVRKESKNGAETYPVYVHRQSGEVRWPWTSFSGEAKSDSLPGELHRGMHGLFRGSGVSGKGSAGRSTVAVDRVAAGTLSTGQTPVVSGSGEVERARRSTVDAWGGFIGAGASRGTGTAWCGVGRAGSGVGVLWRAQSASNTWRCSSARVQQLAEIASLRILEKIRRRPPPGT